MVIKVWTLKERNLLLWALLNSGTKFYEDDVEVNLERVKLNFTVKNA